MVKGVPNFDGLAIMEIESIRFYEQTLVLTAHFAFVSTGNGKTYGKTTCNNWSSKTLTLLEDLKQSMEQDCSRVIFDKGTRSFSGDSSENDTADFYGIGEHLEETPEI